MKKSLVLVFLVLVLGIGLAAQSFVGTWDYYYRWYCNGPYYMTTLTLNANGTFSWGGGAVAGKWYQLEDHNICWEFTNGTIYSGTRVGGVMEGMMNTTYNATGCWYCVKHTFKMAPADMKVKAAESPDGPKSKPGTKDTAQKE